MFIPTYGLGFSLLFTRAVLARFGENDIRLRLNLLPLAAGFFDCLENLCILGMLLMYPATNLELGTLSGIATLCKMALTLVSLLCMGYLGLSLVIRRFDAPHHKKHIHPPSTKIIYEVTIPPGSGQTRPAPSFGIGECGAASRSGKCD